MLWASVGDRKRTVGRDALRKDDERGEGGELHVERKDGASGYKDEQLRSIVFIGSGRSYVRLSRFRRYGEGPSRRRSAEDANLHLVQVRCGSMPAALAAPRLRREGVVALNLGASEKRVIRVHGDRALRNGL